MKEKFPVRSIPADQLPTFDKAKLPAETYALILASTYVEAYGCNILAPYRLSINRLTSNGTLQPNVYSLAGNGFNQTIDINKVAPGYVYSTSPNDIRVASANDKTTLAQFIILSKDSNISGNYYVQSSGAYTFTNGHEYVIGKDYYLGADGYPTTERPDTNAQKLFTVLDSTTIMIDLQLLPDKEPANAKKVI